MRDAVIAAAGMATALGDGVRENVAALLAGKRAFSEPRHFDGKGVKLGLCHELDGGDGSRAGKLLDLLAQDARLTPAQLAAMLGESEEDVAAAIKAYEKNSTILGYKTVVDWDKTSKESVTALIEVKITPQKGMGFDEIARQIYSHHQVESVYLMSGGFDLTVIIKGRTMREVARFVSEQLAPMENVLSTGTHFILKKYKDNSVEFDPADSDKREVMAW